MQLMPISIVDLHIYNIFLELDMVRHSGRRKKQRVDATHVRNLPGAYSSMESQQLPARQPPFPSFGFALPPVFVPFCIHPPAPDCSNSFPKDYWTVSPNCETSFASANEENRLAKIVSTFTQHLPNISKQMSLNSLRITQKIIFYHNTVSPCKGKQHFPST